MKKEALKRIFDFLEEKENHNIPFLWKLINNEPLTKEELIVKGNLNLKGSKITSLPEGLEVGGSLSLIGLAITSLPKSLKVDGYLIINNTPLEKYTDDELREMIQPGFIEGEIYR
jgi:hypothetical protein